MRHDDAFVIRADDQYRLPVSDTTFFRVGAADRDVDTVRKSPAPFLPLRLFYFLRCQHEVGVPPSFLSSQNMLIIGSSLVEQQRHSLARRPLI